MLIITTMPDLGSTFLPLSRCSHHTNSHPVGDVIPAKPSELVLVPDDVIPVVNVGDGIQQQSEQSDVGGDVELEVFGDVFVRNGGEMSEWRGEKKIVEVVVRNEGEGCGDVELEEVTPLDVAENGEMCVADYVSKWRGEKEKMCVAETKLFLPFLVGAPKLAECFVCENVIYPGEEVPCGVRDCKGSYHLTCAKDSLGYSSSSKTFKCPQHACFACEKKSCLWKCSRCQIASHEKCFAFPEYVQLSNDIPWQMVCWRHADDWPPLKAAVPTNSIEEVFCRLPLPNVGHEFKIDLLLRDTVENKPQPPSYLHIRRNIYLVKKKRDDTYKTTGCTDCSSSTCSKECLCRSQSISCSKACRCSERCTNKPFRKEKKIKIVLTELCGWGVEAAESIKKGEFIIEYVGEVISDALCEKRLWDMKNKGIQNFYMCEIRKDFTIDATFKGNASRFLNHSCGPNCNLDKWHVDGETRVGVFAARSIEAGEPLTYDYRFVQFGPEVKCHCGASTCQGYIGTKKKIPKSERRQLPDWGAKRRRTPTATSRRIINIPQFERRQLLDWGTKRRRTPTATSRINRS